MPASPLTGKWIVVTRPEHQAESFTKKCQKVGGCLLHFPLIAITSLNDDITKQKLSKLNTYEMLIFVSANAVEQFIKHIDKEALANKILVTTGQKTARALTDNGLTVDFCPDKLFNSEALLAVEGFKATAKNKNIAIIRGSGGRDYLRNSLNDNAANIDYIDVYSRHCPQQNLNELKTAWQADKLDVVVLTSASSTANFFALAKNEDWMNELTVLIGSPRMENKIPERFKGKILIAEDPSDETIFNKLTLELI